VRTLADLGDLEGKRVLVRVDFNVPLADGEISDDTRIRAALPTIKELRKRGAAVVLVSHLGRPGGERVPELSLAPVAARLGELLPGANVSLAPGTVGDEVTAAAEALSPGDVLLLENIRYEPGETSNDPDLAAALAKLGDVYVNDAFGTAHRAHASTEGVAHLMPGAAGLLMAREVDALARLLENPSRPLVAVLGGAKVSDKIGVIDAFLRLADTLLIGGAMCFPFFAAQGHSVGDSLCADEDVALAHRAIEASAQARARIALPSDLVLADHFGPDAVPEPLDGVDVPAGLMGLDIGPRSADAYAQIVLTAGTVFWNGPMGAFELEPFSAGTVTVARAVAQAPGVTVVGGGDSVAALRKFGLEGEVTHLSTGGGAALELLEGRTLPGVEVLG
jgi:phosphoglycerate kinase